MHDETDFESEQPRGSAPDFEPSPSWTVLAIAVTGPLIAFLKFHVRPVTTAGWLILMAGALVVAGCYRLAERLLHWLGQLDALGSLQSAGRRLAVAMVVVIAVSAMVVLLGMWWLNDPSAESLRQFLAHNFKRGV